MKMVSGVLCIRIPWLISCLHVVFVAVDIPQLDMTLPSVESVASRAVLPTSLAVVIPDPAESA